jgi:hypothetical protein
MKQTGTTAVGGGTIPALSELTLADFDEALSPTCTRRYAKLLDGRR